MVCGGDALALQKIAQRLTDEGVKVQTTTQLVECLQASQHDWDFLLIDLDGLNSFLRSLLSSLCRRFPNLPIIGISTKPVSPMNVTGVDDELGLDHCLSEIPRPEDLIVRFPQVAAKYLCDTGALTTLDSKLIFS
jgi:hypothetical protein